MAHQENGRLMGFVVEGRDWSKEGEEGEPSFSAFVFESNTEGEKVRHLNTHSCAGLTMAQSLQSVNLLVYYLSWVHLFHNVICVISSFTDMLHDKLGEGYYGGKEGMFLNQSQFIHSQSNPLICVCKGPRGSSPAVEEQASDQRGQVPPAGQRDRQHG